jgi:hypothetical protein
VGRSALGRKRDLSETLNDPAQDGKVMTTAANPQLKVAIHTIGPPEVANPWARLKEHKVVQWTSAYAAFAFALLRRGGTEPER